MKNLLLFCIAIGLATFTYFYEELGSVERKKERELQDSLFDSSKVGRLVGFSTKHVSLVSDKTLFRDKDSRQLIDQVRINKVFSILSGLKMTRIIPVDKIKGNEKLYIPTKDKYFVFHFENGKMKVILGKQLDFSQSFYLKIKTDENEKIVIAHDSSQFEGSYMKQDFHKNSQKYQRLFNLLGLGNSYYFDKHVFPKIFYSKGAIRLKSIDIDNIRNRHFHYDFEKRTLRPNAPKGIKLNESAILKMAKDFSHLAAESTMLEFKEEKLSNLVSTIKIKASKGLKYYLKLYKKYGQIDGYFVLTSQNKLFSLKQLKASIFFSNSQDLWNRALPFPKSQFEFKLKLDGRNSEKLTVTNTQRFITSSESLITKHSEFKKLISFFSASAARVSELEENDATLFRKSTLSFSFKGYEFDVIFKENEVLALNRRAGVVYHYLVESTLPFSTDYSTYFQRR